MGLARNALRWVAKRTGYELVKRHQDTLFMELPAEDTFVDQHGNTHPLLTGFRDFCVARWQGMFVKAVPQVGKDAVDNARYEVGKIVEWLSVHGFSVAGKDALEIGCHGGAHAYAMAEAGCKSVVGGDVVEYGVRERAGENRTDRSVEDQHGFLLELRRQTGELFTGHDVQFEFADATQMTFDNDFDLIFSIETLEHIVPPAPALEKMFEALRPGGVCFHAYHPFFCFTRGHSLCTLDFPYGHVLLDASDFASYVDARRPEESEPAQAFFNDSLNRMTIADLKQNCEQAGFEILALMPNPKWGRMRWINDQVVRLARTRYPTLQILDLLAERVIVLLRKPA